MNMVMVRTSNSGSVVLRRAAVLCTALVAVGCLDSSDEDSASSTVNASDGGAGESASASPSVPAPAESMSSSDVTTDEPPASAPDGTADDGTADDGTADDGVLFGGGSGAVSVEVPEEQEPAEPASDVPPLQRCEDAVASGADAVIDDFEDGDDALPERDGRSAEWYNYNSEEDPGHVMEFVEVSGAPGQGSYVLHTYGEVYEWSGVGAGFRWAAPNAEGDWEDCVYDASIYEGFRFWGRGSGESVRFTISVPATLPLDAGGSCEDTCYNNHGIDLVFDEEWFEFFVPFSDLEQPTWGEQHGELDPAEMRTLQFEVAGGAPFDIWVDDLAFYSEGDEEFGNQPNVDPVEPPPEEEPPEEEPVEEEPPPEQPATDAGVSSADAGAPTGDAG